MSDSRERNATPGQEDPPNEPEIQQSIEIYQGPYPPPHLVRAYHEIDPKIAQTTFDLATKSQEHRLKMNELLIASDIRKSERGQIIAAMLAVLLLAGAFTGFALGLPRGGVVAFGVSALLPFLNLASRLLKQLFARSKRNSNA